MPLSLVGAWIVYHVGLFAMKESEFRIRREVWLGRYNTSWHDSSEKVVLAALGELVSHKILFADNFGHLQLTPRGQECWSGIARPNWDHSYRWSAMSPSSDLWDQRIEIRAASYETVISVIARDLNWNQYIAIDVNSIKFTLLEKFYPLRWHCIPHGVQVSFDSLCQSIPIEIVERVYALTKDSELKWHLKFSEAMNLN